MSEVDFAAKCPYCRKNCNCKACLRMIGVEKVCTWYPSLVFPYFLQICLCSKDCLALITCPVILNQPPEKKISEENQRRYAFRIVDLLLPWLKELQQEQMKEKELEGRLQGMLFWCSFMHSGIGGFSNCLFTFLFAGFSMDEVKLEQADCDMDERVYWLNIFPVYILP